MLKNYDCKLRIRASCSKNEIKSLELLNTWRQMMVDLTNILLIFRLFCYWYFKNEC